MIQFGRGLGVGGSFGIFVADLRLKEKHHLGDRFNSPLCVLFATNSEQMCPYGARAQMTTGSDVSVVNSLSASSLLLVPIRRCNEGNFVGGAFAGQCTPSVGAILWVHKSG
jgi:hypothetical protein